MSRDILSESCRSCLHWRYSGEKKKDAKIGLCRQWSPHDYWPKRGARTPKFVAGVEAGCWRGTLDEFVERVTAQGKPMYAAVIPAVFAAMMADIKGEE